MIVAGVIFFYALPALLGLEILRCVWLEYRRDRIPILLYHRLISKAEADAGLVRDDEMIWASYDTVFAEHMNYLRQTGYTTLDMDDYLAIRQGRAARPEKPVVVTFDDGYLSNYTMAYPVLKRNGQKAVIYVAPEPDEHTRRQIEGIDAFLTPEQMRRMAADGVSIQSHTVTHCILTTLDDVSARWELSESRRILSEHTGRPVEHIAIPRAGYSRRIRRLVAEEDYLTACCNNKGSSNGLSSLLALPRIVIERDMSAAAFARALSPRSGVVLRLMGNLKRIPERLGGAQFARRVRNVLYGGPMRTLFEMRNLKRMAFAAAVVYLAGSVGFTWYLVAAFRCGGPCP